MDELWTQQSAAEEAERQRHNGQAVNGGSSVMPVARPFDFALHDSQAEERGFENANPAHNAINESTHSGGMLDKCTDKARPPRITRTEYARLYERSPSRDVEVPSKVLEHGA